jgi:hypothetical protein
MRILLAGLLFITTPLFANPYDSMIDAAAHRHGIEHVVLSAVVQKETRKRPWAFNCDGEGFYFYSKESAVIALWQISKNPWMVKIVTAKKETRRHFFPTQHQVKAFLSAYQNAQIRSGLPRVSERTDSIKEVKRGEARIRQLWVVKTDIGIAQVNYRFHGADRARVQQWFEPAYNLDYAAALIATHKRRKGNDLEAAGDYHSKTPSVRAIYMKELLPIYKKEKERAMPALAIN